MIKALNTNEYRRPEPVRLRDIDFPSPFYEGLQYNAPARGVWNIVHTGMLIPDSHQVYVCAQGCLRGVILTAAEMNDMERMSWVALRESDMWNGEMEKRVIEGTQHILEKIKDSNKNGMPRCVLIYLSCMHMFEGCDFQMITDELSLMYPDIDFVECYMIPTMRKTMSPDAMMKISLYESVKSLEKDDNLVALVGSNLPFDKESDICQLVQRSGKRMWDIADCKDYDEYLKLGSAGLIISNMNVADASCKQLARRLDQKWLKMGLYFDEKKLDSSLLSLGKEIGLSEEEISDFIKVSQKYAYEELDRAREIIGDTRIAIDYTAFPYIIELAELLIRHGFKVSVLYSDGFPEDESSAYERLCKLSPDIEVYPTNEPSMRFASVGSNSDGQKVLAIGQKAAYFTDTPYFVDIVEAGGMYGYTAIRKFAGLMMDAWNSPKDTKKIISHKGWGCESCL